MTALIGPLKTPNWHAIAPMALSGPCRRDRASVIAPTTAGDLRISFHDVGVRLRIGAPVKDYGILVDEPLAHDVALVESDDNVILTAGDKELKLSRSPLAFELRCAGALVQRSCPDGHFTRAYRIAPFARLDNAWLVSLDLGEDAPVYGLGEKWARLDRRGQLIESFNHDALGVNAEISYKNAPFCWSPGGIAQNPWGVFVHTPAPVTHAVGHASWSHRAYVLAAEGEGLDLFLLTGGDGPALISAYTGLTGRAPAPPLWSLGAILSKAYYRTADEVLAAARAVREKGMPCDTITFDGRAWQDTDTRFAFEWDAKRYPDPGVVIEQLKALGFKICVWEYPLISTRNALFNDLAEKGWLLRDARTSEAYKYNFGSEAWGPVLTQLPQSGLLDFTHPDAYAFWRDKHKPLFDLGVDMIKPDFGEQVEDNCFASDGSRGRALHNIYALLYNRCVYEAAALYAKNGPFLFTRSTWSSGQRYPSQWGGDPQADWGGLAASIRGALSWGMTGAPYFATDVGGFYGDTRDDELYVRWLQASVFSAHLRLHGIGAREPWSYGAAAESAAYAALRLRYRLLPYIESAVRQSSETGLPAQRAMALAFPNDRLAWGFDHQWMFGEALLAAGCIAPGGRIEVYLPDGEWVRFPDRTGGALAGGRVHTFKLSLDEIAVFARKGSQIPLGPALKRIEGAAGAAISEHWVA